MRVARPAWAWWVLALLGTFYLILAVTSLRRDSVTVDEFGHLPTGYHLMATGDTAFAEYHPPLMAVLNALPLFLFRPLPNPPDTLGPPDLHSFWMNGYPFMDANRTRYHQLYEAARCVTVLVVGLLGLLLFVWAGELLPGRAAPAGLLAAGLVWFSPGILAHARLVTNDAGSATFIALALYCFHRYLLRPSARTVALAGGALGLALLAKSVALLLAPVILVIALLPGTRGERAMGRTFRHLAVLFLAALLTVNAGYAFRGTLRPLGDYSFRSAPFRALQAALPAWTPVPLPEDYARSHDLQMQDAAEGDPSYLFGRVYPGGRWYYFPALLAVKTPLPLLAVAGWALLVALRRRRPGRRTTLLLLLPGALLLLAMSFSNKQLGLRMTLPAAPLFWLWAAVTLCDAIRGGRRAALLALLLAWAAGETLAIHPRYLTYFNQLAGGPDNGWRIALDSNLDWGQGLIDLRRWLDERGIGAIQLYYFGRVDPAVYGIDYRVPMDQPEPGWLAVGVTLYGREYKLYDHARLIQTPGPIRLDRTVLGEPVATVGHVFHIYRVPPPPWPAPAVDWAGD